MDVLRICENLTKKNVDKTLKNSIESVEFYNLVVDDMILYNFSRFQNYEGVPFSDIGGEYSPYTQEVKNLKGNQVNLYDTGEFYNSFVINEINLDFEIKADTIKDGQDLEEDWGELQAISKDNETIAIAELDKIFWEFFAENL